MLGIVVYVARDSHGSRAAASSDEAGPPAFTPVAVPAPTSTLAAGTSAESGAPTGSTGSTGTGSATNGGAANNGSATTGTGAKPRRPKGTGHGAPHAGAPDLDSRF